MAEIFTLYQSVEGSEVKKKKKFSCLVIALSLKDQMLVVSTQQQSLKGECQRCVDWTGQRVVGYISIPFS